MKVSVIVSTYNSPEWLKKVLLGFSVQTHRDFEVIVADDGSGSLTRELLEEFASNGDVAIRHVWQPDDGFQKCRILNKAAAQADSDYLIFTDGDCIPRRDFVDTHLRYARKGRFLSGGYFKLPMDISRMITFDDIRSQRIFTPEWLKKNGMKIGMRRFKLVSTGTLGYALDRLVPVKKTWNGHGASCFREDLVSVNGFNENMRYGGEDVEFGYRLVNRGMKPFRIRFSTICVHLDHSRGYVSADDLQRNREIINTTRRSKAVWTENGIQQHMQQEQLVSAA